MELTGPLITVNGPKNSPLDKCKKPPASTPYLAKDLIRLLEFQENDIVAGAISISIQNYPPANNGRL